MPPRRRSPIALLALAGLATGCARSFETPAPLDRLVSPTSMVVHDGKLLVVSTNFQLEYDEGSLVTLDPESAPTAFVGGARIGSLGGDLAIADPDACGLPRAQAVVPSRSSGVLHRLDLDADSAPSCGDACEVPLDDGPLDPYGVAVTCPPGGPARAWVGYLRTAEDEGYVTAVDLLTGDRQTLEVADAVVRSFAYDVSADRLFFTTALTGAAAPLGWISLGGGCTVGHDEWDGGCPIRSLDLTELVSGIDLAGLALSNAQPGLAQRAYVAARVYDTDLAEASGERPDGDIGGLLLVLELEQRGDGDLGVTLVRSVPIGLGVSEVRVLPAREGRRDLVAVTAYEDELLALYDDDAGALQKVFSRDETTGAPLLGRMPFGLAVERRDSATGRVYVASFEEHFVTAIDVPLEAPWNAALVGDGEIRRIGERVP